MDKKEKSKIFKIMALNMAKSVYNGDDINMENPKDLPITYKEWETISDLAFLYFDVLKGKITRDKAKIMQRELIENFINS